MGTALASPLIRDLSGKCSVPATATAVAVDSDSLWLLALAPIREVGRGSIGTYKIVQFEQQNTDRVSR